MKSYWMKEDLVFHCPTISKIMFQDHFMALTRCFHITNLATYVTKRCEKLRQTRWLIERICENCVKVWKLRKMCTIDEMMICYKGTYCLLRQYVLQKP
jgi:hypothetical protein